MTYFIEKTDENRPKNALGQIHEYSGSFEYWYVRNQIIMGINNKAYIDNSAICRKRRGRGPCLTLL